MQRLQIRTAMVETTRVMSRSFLVICAPLVAIMFGMRGLEFASHKVLGKGETWANLLLVFAICYPLNFFANCVVSAMTLRMTEEGTHGSFAQIREVAKFPGLFRSMLRWLLRVLFWVLPAIGVLLLVFVVSATVGVTMAYVAGHAPAGANPGRLGKRTTHALLLGSLVLYEGMLSRYTFLMPMIARARVGSTKVMEMSIQLAKDHWTVLWIGATADCALTLGIYEMTKAVTLRFSVGLLLSEGLHAVDLLMVAILSSWYWIVTTILMQQATKQVDGVVSNQPVVQ